MAEQVEHHEGGCLCGRLRYRITGPIDSVGHCHCGMCRRSSGGIVVTWMTVAPERFAFIGSGKPAVYQSSEDGRRSFCRDCGSQITFSNRRSPHEIDVTLATLDDVRNHPADRHVFVKDRLPWLHLDEHLPEHQGFTPSSHQ